jgi:hypothetical protein
MPQLAKSDHLIKNSKASTNNYSRGMADTPPRGGLRQGEHPFESQLEVLIAEGVEDGVQRGVEVTTPKQCTCN